jgi:hypothetical protein
MKKVCRRRLRDCTASEPHWPTTRSSEGGRPGSHRRSRRTTSGTAGRCRCATARRDSRDLLLSITTELSGHRSAAIHHNDIGDLLGPNNGHIRSSRTSAHANRARSSTSMVLRTSLRGCPHLDRDSTASTIVSFLVYAERSLSSSTFTGSHTERGHWPE